MAPVRPLQRVRALLLVTVVLVLATGCGDVLDPGGLGTLHVRLVLDTTRAVGSQTAPAVEYATILRVLGPTTKTVSMTLAGDSYEGTVSDLTPGSYTVIVEGRADGAVDHYGRTDGVVVRAGSSTTATMAFGSFVPSVTVGLGSPTTSVVIPVRVSAVSGAEAYELQWSASPTFASASTITVPAGVVDVTLTAPGVHYFRGRAVSADVPDGRFSAADSLELATDDVGATATAARPLGFGTAVNGTVTQLNILPIGDEDWFAVGACQGDTIVTETMAARLSPASPLNTILAVRDAGGTSIDGNDDAVLTDSRLVTLVPSDQTVFVAVSGSAGTTGHYELLVEVRPGPRNTGTACSPP